jgi:hypothetical protein
MISASNCRPLNSADGFRFMLAEAYQTSRTRVQHNRPASRYLKLSFVLRLRCRSMVVDVCDDVCASGKESVAITWTVREYLFSRLLARR